MTTWNWRLLRAGAFRLDGGSMFGVVPKAIWSRLVTPDDANRIPLQTNCLLLTPEDSSDERRVLVETGYGNKWSDKERSIFALEDRTIADALREADVEPDAITHVIVTHLHFDHAGGLTTLDGGEVVPTFPNAEVIVQRTEWEDALANKSTMTRTYLRENLAPVAERVRPVEGEVEAIENGGVYVEPAVGHTWGQQAVRFTGRPAGTKPAETPAGTVCFPGDVMPTRNHAGAAFSMGYDMLPWENMRTKSTLLGRAHAQGWTLVLDHEPGDPAVRVVPDEEHEGRWKLRDAEVAHATDQPRRTR